MPAVIVSLIRFTDSMCNLQTKLSRVDCDSTVKTCSVEAGEMGIVKQNICRRTIKMLQVTRYVTMEYVRTRSTGNYLSDDLSRVWRYRCDQVH